MTLPRKVNILDQTGSDWFKLVQTGFNWFNLDRSSLIQSDPVWSSLIQRDPGRYARNLTKQSRNYNYQMIVKNKKDRSNYIIYVITTIHTAQQQLDTHFRSRSEKGPGLQFAFIFLYIPSNWTMSRLYALLATPPAYFCIFVSHECFHTPTWHGTPICPIRPTKAG